MKITETKITKKVLTDLKALDPVTYIAEDFGGGRGKLMIDCYGKAWTNYWGAMGCDSVAEFINSAESYYIARKLTTIPAEIIDYETVGEKLGHDVCRDSLALYADDLESEYGEEWWNSLPTTGNPDFLYLLRIVNAVKAAIKLELSKAA